MMLSVFDVGFNNKNFTNVKWLSLFAGQLW
jgi:hypothetical protein